MTEGKRPGTPAGGAGGQLSGPVVRLVVVDQPERPSPQHKLQCSSEAGRLNCAAACLHTSSGGITIRRLNTDPNCVDNIALPEE